MRSKANVQKGKGKAIPVSNPEQDVADRDRPNTSQSYRNPSHDSSNDSLSPIRNPIKKAGKFTASTPKHATINRGKDPSTQNTPFHYRRSKRIPRVAKNIIKLRRTTELLLRKLPFSRLVREIANNLNVGGDPYRWQITALAALQESAEYYLISLMEAAYHCSIHAKRVTLMPKDLKLVRYIRQED